MACFDKCQNVSTTKCDTIADLLKRIEKMQNEAVLANAASNCNTCIISPMYNTKPIAVYLCDNQLEAMVGTTGTTTNLFRVEEVRGNDTVLLRLLQNADGEVTCTNNTIICRLSCICAIQCFESINCTLNCMIIA